MTMETNDPRHCIQCEREATTECDCAPRVTFLELSRFEAFCMLVTAFKWSIITAFVLILFVYAVFKANGVF